MEFFKYYILIVLAITILLMLIFALKSHRFFKTLFFNALFGILSLTIINLTSRFSGVYIPVNYYSAATGGVLGLPGIFGLLIANFIFI